MRQAQWTDDSVSVTEMSPGPLKEGWVRLRVEACGICGSDLHSYRREFPVTTGSVPGHEAAGSIMSGGSGLADALYALEPHTSCGRCDPCVSGNAHLCVKGEVIGGRAQSAPGGLADFIDVPSYAIFPIDTSVSAAAASISEPLAVCVRAINMARLNVDSRVLVLGAGSIGLLTGMLARDRAGQVAITARYPHQRKMATKIGLQALEEADVAAWAREESPDVVIETAGGSADTFAQAVRLCRPAGRIVLLGVFTSDTPVNAFSIVVKELTVLGSVLYGSGRRGPIFKAAVSLLPRYREEIGLIQTHRFSLDALNEAFACALDKRSGAVKVVIEP